MNTRFVVRGTLLALVVVLAATALSIVWVNTARFSPLDPTPPRPVLEAPSGELPTGAVGLSEYTQYANAEYNRVGCGFIFSLDTERLVGATTAHSLSFNAASPLQRIALGVVGQSGFVVEFDRLHGLPGTARSGEDMTVDYVLLHAASANSIDPALILRPDVRGQPQPGERVILYSGLQPGQLYSGTVQSASAQAVWVVMDDTFDPSGLSGSPFVSQHTGQVVGMVIATTQRSGRVLLGAHPIGSLVRLVEEATKFPLISTYRK
ncbi:MAG: hypothetical protein KA765_10495 [Thermoflexales bacterium]|nr:hypothetical protein [Thermoflexales bacterium]